MPNQDPKLSSLEAAALYLSDGTTKDPVKAAHIANGGNPFDLDALQRAHLRRMMGMDFSIDVQEKNIVVKSKEAPYLTQEAEFSGIIDEAAVDVLVDTCLKLKEAWEIVKAEESEDDQ